MPEVNVPGIGPVEPKYVWIGGGLTAGIVAYAYYKHRQAAASATLVTDPTTGALAATGGSPPPIQPAAPDTSGLITTNTQWTQDVLNKLGATGSVDLGVVLNAISKYLAGIALTADEASIVRQAWAVSGKPPEGPANIILAGTGTGAGTPPPPSGGGGGTTPSVPGAVSGLHITGNRVAGPSNVVVTVAWNAASGATGYRVTLDDPWNLGQFAQDVSGTSATISNIQALGNHIRVNVTPHNAAGNGPTASVTATAAGRFVPPARPIVNHF